MGETRIGELGEVEAGWGGSIQWRAVWVARCVGRCVWSGGGAGGEQELGSGVAWRRMMCYVARYGVVWLVYVCDVLVGDWVGLGRVRLRGGGSCVSGSCGCNMMGVDVWWG